LTDIHDTARRLHAILDPYRKTMYTNSRNVQRCTLGMPVSDDDPVLVPETRSGDPVRSPCGREATPGAGLFALELSIDDERS